MNILLDTHYLLWYFLDTRRFSQRTRKIFADPENQLLYSSISLWEIALKYATGRLQLHGIDPVEFYETLCASDLECLNVTTRQMASSWLLPRIHKDPFDRMMVWQAISNNLLFASLDSKLDAYSQHGLRLLGT